MDNNHRIQHQTASYDDDAIAVVGMACRFPGGANSPDDFWALIEQGRSGICELDDNRWNQDYYYDPDPDVPGKSYTRHAGLIEDIDCFDAGFFGVSHREAKELDPQQRLLLEVCWHAMEDAGIPRSVFSGSRTGLFTGLSTDDYSKYSLNSGQPDRINPYSSLGNARSLAVGRVAYALNLKGPALQLDTSCSSSLMAVQLAVGSLHAGDCDVALASGVNLLVTPENFISLSKLGALSKTGSCKPFDEDADGYVRGEGCGVVVLQRYADAKHAGRRILAVIHAVAANHDGKSNGLTAPNGRQQENVIRETFRKAGVQPGDVAYFETHGTGTPLGDPIEVISLANVIGETAQHKIPIGSLKADIGHLEACAGIASLMKAVLMLQHNKVVRQANVTTLNSKIPWADIPLFVPSKSETLREGDGERLIGVSSFGMSGTNVHCLLGYDPQQLQPPIHEVPAGGVLTISARSSDALLRYAKRYQQFLRTTTQSVGEIMSSSNLLRSHFEYRVAVVGRNAESLIASLEKKCATPVPFSRSGPGSFGFVFSDADDLTLPDVLVFCRSFPAYRETFDECRSIIELQNGSLPSTLLDYGKDGIKPEPELHHALWFAHQLSIAGLLGAAGATPNVVLGRGVGEYAAAAFSGVLSLEDAVRLILARASLPQRLRRRGTLLEVGATAGVVETILHSEQISLEITSVEDAAGRCTLAGESGDLDQLKHRLDERSICYNQRNALVAYNSSYIDPIICSLESLSRTIVPQSGRIPMISSLSGRADTDELMDQNYWVQCLRAPVQFHAALTCMQQAFEVDSIIDIGTSLQYRADVSTLPQQDERRTPQQLDEILAALYENGVSINWRRVRAASRPVNIPNYPFKREHFWVGKTDGLTNVMLNGANSGAFRQLSEERISRALSRHQQSIDALSVDQEAFKQVFEAILADLTVGDEKALRVYDIKWKSWLYEAQAENFAMAEITAHARDGLRRSSQAANVQEAAQGYPHLEHLAEIYARCALIEMGWRKRAGDTFELADLVADLKVDARQARFLGRVLEIAGVAQVKVEGAQSWRVTETVEDIPAPGAAEEAAIPEALGAELTVLRQCGAALAGVLRGECDAKEVIFKKGDLSSSTHLYQDSPLSQIMNGAVRDCVESIVNAKPQFEPVRILELGAGTGATTSYVLPVLDGQRHEYWFTDVSTFFLKRAKTKFDSYRNVHYRLYNAERSGEEQGITETFDIIIAANVVHATKDVSQALANMRDILKPNGVVLFIEGNRPLKWLDVFAGSLEGWWRFIDTELRGEHPLLGVHAWNEVLTGLGYVDCGDITPDAGDVGIGMLSQQSIIFARKPLPIEAECKRTWLIVGDGGAPSRYTDKLQDRCTAKGIEVTLVTAEKLVDAVRRARSLGREVKVINIVSGGFGEGRVDEGALDACIKEAQTAVQIISSLSDEDDVSLWNLTNGAVPIEHAQTEQQALQSIIHGYLKVAAVEYSAVKQSTIDLLPDADKHDLELVQQLIAEDRGDTQYAVRSGKIFVPRIVPSTLQHASTELTVKSGKYYVIAGGNGALGRQTIEYLAHQGAEHIVVLTRRHDTDVCRDEIIVAVGRENAQIDIETCDINHADQVSAVIDKYTRNGRILGGVFHTAGIRAQQDLDNFDLSQAHRVLNPKVLGVVNLYHAIKDRPLDFFICYSSMVSLWGAAKLGHYCAANQFLDVYAALMATGGVPSVSINWGPLSDGGMAHEAELRELSGQGVHPVRLRDGLKELTSSSVDGCAEVLVADVDWNKFIGNLHARGTTSEMFEEVAALDSYTGKVQDPSASRQDQLESTQVADISVLEYLKGLIGSQLEIPLEGIDVGKSLVEYGVDSLMAVDLRDSLHKDQGVRLEMVRFMSDTSIAALIDEIMHKKSEGAKAAPVEQADIGAGAVTTVAETAPLSAEQIDGMTGDEIEALFKAMSKGKDLQPEEEL